MSDNGKKRLIRPTNFARLYHVVWIRKKQKKPQGLPAAFVATNLKTFARRSERS
jgi:hypothetical protein